MGCASSKDESESLDDSSTLVPPSNPVPTQANSPTKNWKKDTRAIWAREFEKLPVHSDVPRLGRKISIMDGDELLCGPDDYQGKSKEEIVYKILHTLTKRTGDEERLKILEERYSEYIKEGGDIAQQLLALLKEVITEDSKVARVLKACHQRVIFPGYYTMKRNIYATCPFKDSRGSWEVKIIFTPGDETGVSVNHTKEQVSHADWHTSKAGDDAGAPPFTFKWNLSLLLSTDYSSIESLGVTVVKLIVSDSVPDDKVKEIQETIVVDQKIGDDEEEEEEDEQ